MTSRTAVYLGALATSALMFGLLVFAITQRQASRNMNAVVVELQRVVEEQRVGLECVLWQFGSHRENEFAADDAILERLGGEHPAPAPRPTDVRIDPAVCATYFATTSTPPTPAVPPATP